MKKVFVFRHVAHEHLGTIANTFARQSIPLRYFDLADDGDCPVELDEASGLILMGGPMSANDPLGYLSQELYLIEEAMQRSLPILGVCLGAQLIAKAAGSRVYPNARKEIGWFPVYRTNETLYDPLFRGFGESETVFHWHGETFDLPEGALWLARSDACRHQAFRLGTHTYGIQFHLEVTPEMISEWCRQDEACGDRREVIAPIDPHVNASRMAELTDQVISEWSVFLHIS
jgi:GMP synthase-like glutamine amidotransferase